MILIIKIQHLSELENKMKVPIIYIPKTRFKKFIFIEKRYKSNGLIIPLGCDCHPAYMLNSLYLRTSSLPFDWLNIDPIITFEYVSKNINDKFNFFLKNPKLNDRGYFISPKYPYSEFMHEKDLNNQETINKFRRRIDRFFSLIKTKKIQFLHNIPVNSLHKESDIYQYISDIKLFQSIIPSDSTIHIYMRYDENLSENELLSEKLYNELNNLNIYTYKYVRGLKKNGIWGLKSHYHSLLINLDIKIKITFPKIFIK